METIAWDDDANAIISSVIDLPLEDCTEAITTIIRSKALNPHSSRKLLSRIISTIEQKQKCCETRCAILRYKIDLSPHTYPFMIFRQVRIAELLLHHPASTHAHLRTAAQTKAYNVGLRDQLELLDVLASDPEHILRGFAAALAADEHERRFGACSLREICCVMAHLVDDYNAEICAVYEQYRTVPTWGEIEGSVGKGREGGRKDVVGGVD